MKRSEVNALIENAMRFLERENFKLPPFAFWTPKQWARKGKEADEIRECMLGWDITDFGLGKFPKMGLVLFTVRNGRLNHPKYGNKTYCEKILLPAKGQLTPLHFHWNKVEDIINRGGGIMAIRFYNSTPDDRLAKTPVTVSVDGVERTIKAGGTLRLKPGESVTIPQRLYHDFWAVGDMVLGGEVSRINDDRADNRFYEPIGRFPQIEEDEPARHLLFSEYPV